VVAIKTLRTKIYKKAFWEKRGNTKKSQNWLVVGDRVALMILGIFIDVNCKTNIY